MMNRRRGHSPRGRAAPLPASTGELLRGCEERGAAPPYVVAGGTYREEKGSIFQQAFPLRTEPVPYGSNGEDIFVVSDLHIASGRNEAGVYRGTENFFADESFERFLANTAAAKEIPAAVLVLNGDVFDFLRVTEFPGKVTRPRLTKRIVRTLKRRPVEPVQSPDRGGRAADAFVRWSVELGRIGITRSPGELESAITAREKIYGLGTDDVKAVYKLMLIRAGHPAFFRALSGWLDGGNRLVVVKGNHDLEWYWPAVRNYFRLILAEGMEGGARSMDIAGLLADVVLPSVTFIDDALLIDGRFYIEHGHRYDKFAMVLDSPTLAQNPVELALPFGSFFNRYLLNRVELFYPFLDNVTPGTNVLPLMVKENFPLALKILFHHVPLVLRVLSTRLRYVWFMVHSVLWLVLALLAPVVFALIIAPGFVGEIEAAIGMQGAQGIAGTVSSLTKNFGVLAVSYFLARIVGWYQLEEPSSLEAYAVRRQAGSPFTLMTMGHTHTPGERRMKTGCRFFNTGTWIPAIEFSGAAVREDRTFPFLHVSPGEAGKTVLQRWNDDALRGEPLTVIERD